MSWNPLEWCWNGVRPANCDSQSLAVRVLVAPQQESQNRRPDPSLINSDHSTIQRWRVTENRKIASLTPVSPKASQPVTPKTKRRQ